MYPAKEQKGLEVVAYEFYWRDPGGGNQIIGVLPERRKNLGRITQESIMRL
jgi:hypothetical protein